MTLAIDNPTVDEPADHPAREALRRQFSCAHCGLPVPRGLVSSAAAQEQFCCEGCRTVYSVIHSCGMEQYYAFLRRQDSANTANEPAHTTGKGYREFDDPSFLAIHAPLRTSAGQPPVATRTIEFYLEGVHCAACVWLVEKLPAVVRGVIESRLDLSKCLVRITWVDDQTPTATRVSTIARTLDSLGYPPHPARSNSAREVRTRDDRRQLIRIGVAGACAGNAMLLGTALYAGLFARMDPAYTLLFRWLSMLIGALSLLWPGSVFFRGAWAAIRTRSPHLDLPIALALGAGGLVGILNTILNRGDIYFDSLSVLVFLLLVGRFLQHRRQGVAEEAVELLFSLTPMAAHRVQENGAIEEVPIGSLTIGEVVEVRAGESIPVDGQILDGYSTTVDESLLTGESRPKHMAQQSILHAGTTNIASTVRLKVLATGESTRVGKLMHLVTTCSRNKAPMVLLADRIAGYFLLAVVAIAALVFVVWYIHGSPRAIDYAVATLIVACPCALGLATPLAVTVAIGRAARRGIMLKGGDTLERLARTSGQRILFLDKTGTLTRGRTELQFWQGDEGIKSAVRAVENDSTHPIARAFCAAFVDQPPILAKEVVQDMRGGISGWVAGRRIVMGSPAFVMRHCGPNSDMWNTSIEACLKQGLTPVVIAADGIIRAIAGIGDALRPDARQAVELLRRGGWQLGILSGDHPQIVARIAQQVGIPADAAQGGLSPEDKLDRVRRAMSDRSAHATVVMVGDGVNDAGALAAASVGIAVHGGAEASLAAASVYLNRPGLMGIVSMLEASQKTLAVIRRSFIASVTYNLFAITLAAFGWINPLLAAILMPISSLTVLSLAFGTRTFSHALPQNPPEPAP